MPATPGGWPRISPSLFHDDAGTAIEWLSRASGFEVRLRVDGEGASVVHSELTLGEGLVLVATAGRHAGTKSPRTLGGASTQGLFVYLDDADARRAQARAAGARIVSSPIGSRAAASDARRAASQSSAGTGPLTTPISTSRANSASA